MTNRIAFILTLSFSFLFGVDTPKEIDSPSQIVTEIQFDAEVFQQNLQIKKGMIQNYKQARKAKRIPKPAGSPIYLSNKKNGAALKKETSAKRVLKDKTHLEKRENAKQKLNELRAQAKAGNTTVTHDVMRKIKLDHQTTTRSRSRSIGGEFEFETIAELYVAFGDVLATVGSGCDGCPGNLDEMEVEASFPIFRQDSFEAWAYDSVFTAFYFQFIDENESGEYDDGEIYAVSCEDSEISSNKTVAYNGSVYDLDFVDFWAIAYDFDWDNDDEDDFTYLGEFDGHEYWLSGFEATWNDANNMFNDYYEEVHLVTISSQEENDFVQENVGDLSVWIGFTDEAEEGNWEWVTGEEVVYTNWGEGEPNNMNGEEHWAEMAAPNQWNDLAGDIMRHFVVEVVNDTTGGGDYFIEGIVRDFDGNPIPGATVWAIDYEGYYYYSYGTSSVTNEGGYYHIELDTSGSYRVEVYTYEDEYWPDLTMIESGEGGTQHDFMLGHSSETVFLDIYAVAPDPDWYYWDLVSYAEVNSPQSPQIMSYTDWWGTDYVTVYPSEGFADIFGFTEEYGEAHVQIENIEAGMDYFVDLIFEDDSTGDLPSAIYGSVQDIDGSRIPYAEVSAWNYDNYYAVTTDEYGDYFMEVPAGYYDMEAWAPGYSPEMDWVEVYPNEYTWVEFWLHQENDYNTLVHGYVHDVDGNPLSFANVNANYLYDDWESEGTFTNEDGYYELYLRDDAYRITAGAEGFWVSAYDSIYVGGDSLWLDFMLSPVGEFDGGWQGNINLVGDHQPQMIYLAIMSEDYQVFRILDEPGPQEVELVNGNYHILAGADGYREVLIMNAINIQNNVVNFDIHLVQDGLLLPPQIDFAGDVPNDQGRQMRLVWNPGVPGDWGYFEFFSIWRQVNEAPMVLWDFVTTVPWHGMESYSAVVPTLGDSTDMGIYWSTFRVTGHTENPNEFYDSAPVSGYSIDNLHPGAPGGVQAFTGEEGILLTWDSSIDEDFGYHRIYRHDTDSSDPAIQFTTVDTFYVDGVAEGNYEYWITAVDLNGNESDPSIIVTVTLAVDNGLAVPIEFALQQNYPNPFNPSTQIQYALPTDANVSIAIYDLMGRQIRTLVNQQVSAGYHSVMWNATSDMGSPVSAGVYIYTITANDFRDVKKMILLK
jgi:hypothetical protein